MSKLKKSTVSLHPKLAALFDLIISFILLVWFRQASNWWFLFGWFLVRSIWWAVLIRFVYYSPGVERAHHLLSLLVFNAGVFLFLLFTDLTHFWYLMAGIFACVSALSFWFLPVVATDLSFVGKPQRRFRFLLTTLGLAGIWSGINAIMIFNLYPIYVWWVWILMATGITTFISGVWWREYGVSSGRAFWCWLAVLFVLFSELAACIMVWPTGYLVNGLIVTWIWYVFWFLGRYQLSQEGMYWKKQLFFLSTNLVALVLFLSLVIRWH